MGLLDRFRGGGKNEKEEELEENIEKIREKIQGGPGGRRDLSRPPAPDRESGGAPQPPAEGDEERAQGSEPPAHDRSGGERSRPPRGADRPQAGGEPQPSRPDRQPERGQGPDRAPAGESGETRDRASPERPDPAAGQAGTGRQGGQQRPGSGGERRSDRQESGDGGAPDSTELPEPPELTEIDVSEVEGGSLYVTVDTFRDTLQAVADLRSLARDLDDHVGSMEGTLEEDRETARGVEQLLGSADDRIEEMRDLMTE